MAHAKEAVRRYAASLGRGWQIEGGRGVRISKGELIFVISEQEPRVEPVREYVIARLETPGVVAVGPLSFKYADSFERGDLATTAEPALEPLCYGCGDPVMEPERVACCAKCEAYSVEIGSQIAEEQTERRGE